MKNQVTVLALEKMRCLALASVRLLRPLQETNFSYTDISTHTLLNESKQARPISNASIHPHTCACMTTWESVCVVVWHGKETELRTGLQTSNKMSLRDGGGKLGVVRTLLHGCCRPQVDTLRWDALSRGRGGGLKGNER